MPTLRGAVGGGPLPSRRRETRTLRIALRDDGVLHARPRATHLDQTLDDVRANLQACRELLAGQTAPILVDMRGMGTLTREARLAYAHEAEFATRQAMLVDSAFTRIAANLFIRVAGPRQPTRMFTSEEEALAWCQAVSA